MAYAACLRFGGMGRTAILWVAPASQQNRGGPKGFPFGTRLCLQSVVLLYLLYLLSRLAGKMRVSPYGNIRFARQENGQVFADGDEQKPEPVSGVAVGI